MDDRGKKRLPPFSYFQNGVMSKEDIEACVEHASKLHDSRERNKSKPAGEGSSSTTVVVSREVAKQKDKDVDGKHKPAEVNPVLNKGREATKEELGFNPNPEEDYGPEVLKDAWNYEEEEEDWSCVWHNPYSGEDSDSDLSSRGDRHWK
ncbi:hypothetical protein Hanom_Chr06g00511501 [Helianthus anomalus]